MTFFDGVAKGTTLGLALVAILCLVLLTSLPIHAQVTGATLSGTITDSSGAAIPNARVSIKNSATGVARDVTTDSAGFYLVPNLLPGSYNVTFSAPGFATLVQSNLTLEVGGQQQLNQKMQVGQITQSVEVTTEAPTVQLTSSAISAEVTSTTVRELPLNGRDWTSLATLQPGISSIHVQASVEGNTPRNNRGFGNQISAVGHRPFENNYRLNGISINDYTNGSPGSVLGANLGVDAIQEFSVLTSNYSAEYGRTSGGVINAITKSGTNQFHGSAYYFLRDEGLDARNFFDPAQIPPFHRNQFGISGGAPIKKNKAFVFADYEGIRQAKSMSFHDKVPTAALRAGTLCSVPSPGSTCTPHPITGAVNPDLTTGIDKAVLPYLPLYPLPNAGLVPNGNGDTGFFDASGQARVPENYLTIRGDYTISDKDSLAASWFFDNSSLIQPDALLVATFAGVSHRQFASLEETHIFSATLTNTARLGFNRTTGTSGEPGTAINPLGNDPSLGVRPGLNAPILTVPGLTQMAGALGDPPHGLDTQNTFQVYDDAFLVRGKHSLKFGFAGEYFQQYAIHGAPNGTFGFPSLTGFLTNQPKNLTLIFVNTPGLPPNSYGRAQVGALQKLFGGYLQDDWRVRSNLTLNLGVRYEPTTLPTEVHNKYQLLTDLYSGFPGPVHNPWQTNNTLKNFEPRAGFAWDPFHNGKTAIRGGFGIFDILPIPWTYVFTISTAYPFSTRGSVGNLPAGSFPTGAAALLGVNPSRFHANYFEQHPPASYAENWNLNIQREVVPNLTATVGYVGSHTVHNMFVTDDADMVLPTSTSAGYLWPFPVGSGTRFNQSVGVIGATFWDDSASYHALEAQLIKRMSHGFQFQGSYTWSKCLDSGSSGSIADPFANTLPALLWFAPQGRRGLCDFDIRHNFVANFVWELPTPGFGGAFAEHILGGWEVGGIATLSSGTPTTLVIGGDPLGQNSSDPISFVSRVTGPGCSNPINPGNVNNYFKLNCFSPPTAPASFAAVCQPAAASVAAVIPNTCMNLFGNAGRNSVIGPGLVEFDFSMFKNIPVPRISEAFKIQFRAEFFNITNRANFQVPNFADGNDTIFNQDGTLAGGAGTIDATATDSRQIQFGLKIVW